MDLRRVRSHRIAAENLKKLLETEGDYDLLYAEIPPNDVALAAAEFAKAKGIPFVADVNDLWPEAMRMVLDIPVVSDIFFTRFCGMRKRFTAWFPAWWEPRTSTETGLLRGRTGISQGSPCMWEMRFPSSMPAQRRRSRR